jgi:single-strand DNA-binding protein
MSSTSTTIVGNLTRDPELRFTTNAKAVCGFGLAVTPRRIIDGEWTDGDTSFFNVTCWGQLAENVAASLQKGARVIVTGSLVQRSWEDKETQAKRSTIEVSADEVGPSLAWATASVVKPDRVAAGAR